MKDTVRFSAPLGVWIFKILAQPELIPKRDLHVVAQERKNKHVHVKLYSVQIPDYILTAPGAMGLNASDARNHHMPSWQWINQVTKQMHPDFAEFLLATLRMPGQNKPGDSLLYSPPPSPSQPHAATPKSPNQIMNTEASALNQIESACKQGQAAGNTAISRARKIAKPGPDFLAKMLNDQSTVSSSIVKEVTKRDTGHINLSTGRLNRKPVMFDIFSGTGAVGKVFREEFGYQVYSLDINPTMARRSKGDVGNVRTFAFEEHWPKEVDLIWFSPPCTPWSNATKQSLRMTPSYQAMGQLCEFSVHQLVKRLKPRGFILENPRFTALAKMPYMANLKYEYVSYCQYGRPFQKKTVLWMSDSINLKLKDCDCKGPHEVKLGGSYNGQRRWSKKHLKGAVPAPLVRSIARQLHKQWGLQTPAARPRLTHGARIGRAFVKVLPDTGASKAHCTSQTLAAILKLNKGQRPPAMLIRTVPTYKVELADGNMVTGNTEAVADVHLITPSGSAVLTQVNFNVVPGKLAPLIMGRAEF